MIMREDERAGLVEAVGGTVRGIVDTVEGVHKAVASTSFRGRRSAVPKALHDAIAAVSYGSVRAAAGPVAGGLARLLKTDEASLSDSRRGAYALAVIDAWAGDALAATDSALAVPLGVRVAGRAVPPTTAGLSAAFPEPSSTVAVFLHGLGETEIAWGFQPRRAEGARPLAGYPAAVLAAGATPVLLRYNSGEHVSSNGHRLADLLDGLVEHWPVPVQRLVLVGHSMGGLIIRSACHLGATYGAAWVPLVSDTLSLSTPHHGAGLERLANLGTTLLGATKWTRPFERLANTRSAGVKDLRFGNLLDEDWVDADPDELWTDRATEVPLLATARHHMVAASLSGNPEGRGARVIGDLLVVPRSAHGQQRTARRSRFVLEETHHLPGTHHFSLLNHPAVAELLTKLLGPSPAGAHRS